uniref:Ig-like domain-containing protein n=1 Tax=Xenopus tropicalis TaxID=8364 RepID=A0A803KBL4_XENTR
MKMKVVSVAGNSNPVQGNISGGKTYGAIMPLHRVPLRGEFPFQKVTVILLCLAHTVVTEPGVKCKLLGPPVIGGNATLRCHLPGSFEVLQVTWQRSKDGFREKIATYSKRYGVNVLSPFTKRVEVNTDPKKSSMKVSALTEEDEACYICVFNVYQHGAYTGQVCLPALVSSNAFICSADGSEEHIPNITLNPPKTNTDPTLQSEGGIIRAIRKGTLTGEDNLTCTFQLPRTGRQKRDITEQHNDLDDISEETVSINCSASGKTKPYITWEYEGKPISTEYKEKVIGDITTVRSTHWYSQAWLLAQDKPIICHITTRPSDTGNRREPISTQEDTAQNLLLHSFGKQMAHTQGNPYVRLVAVIGAVGAVFGAAAVIALCPVCVTYWKTKARPQNRDPQSQPLKEPSCVSKECGTPNTHSPSATSIPIPSTPGSVLSERKKKRHNEETENITATPKSAAPETRPDFKSDQENKPPKRKLFKDRQ